MKVGDKVMIMSGCNTHGCPLVGLSGEVIGLINADRVVVPIKEKNTPGYSCTRGTQFGGYDSIHCCAFFFSEVLLRENIL